MTPPQKSSKRSLPSHRVLAVAVVLGLGDGGCAAGARSGEFVTANELPQASRRPAGVLVDPSPELPKAEELHDGDSALVALKPPLPEKAARAIVAAFFRAIVSEDPESLSELVTPDASATSTTHAAPTSMLDHWRGRMHHFKYQTLAGETLYQNVDVELYRYADLETLVPGRPPRPVEMGRSDVLIKVPMLVVRSGADRVFGDEIVFLLQRDRDRFRVRQTMEDFQMP